MSHGQRSSAGRRGRTPAPSPSAGTSNEEGLRALGSQLEGSDRGDVDSEEKLRALGAQVEGTDQGPVANEEGLRALGQRVDEAAAAGGRRAGGGTGAPAARSSCR